MPVTKSEVGEAGAFRPIKGDQVMGGARIGAEVGE